MNGFDYQVINIFFGVLEHFDSVKNIYKLFFFTRYYFNLGRITIELYNNDVINKNTILLVYSCKSI